MWSAATVLVCALDLLGRSASALPPIVLLEVRPAHVSALADAFVEEDGDTIFLLTKAPAFRRLQHTVNKCGDVNAVRKIASVLVHEEWHVRHGSDERGAYDAQLMALAAMNAGPGNPVYFSVARSRDWTLAQGRDALEVTDAGSRDAAGSADARGRAAGPLAMR